MIFNKKKLNIVFILFVVGYMTLTCELIVNASETQIIKADEIENGAINHLIKELPWNRESLDINIYYREKDIVLPPGKKELIYKIMNSSQRAGRIPLILEIRVDDQFKKRIRINTKVLVSQKVVKTVHAVRRGDILSNDEIKVETIQTERPLKNAITNINSALGYEATRNISIGKILIPNYIKRPALGNRGDKILIMAQKGGMIITTPGILKEDGYENTMVRVLNMDSKKIIYGRLVDSNTVKVKF
jgi:flagellar basal body P-ring formation protein FlgA